MSDLREIATRLRQLGTKRPRPEFRSEVIAALSSKWEGIQAVAAEVLGRWGDRKSVETLRDFLIRCLDREAGWAIRGVVVRALRGNVTSEDVGWVLDLYFSVEAPLLKHELLGIVLALPVAEARERLVAALSDLRWENRQAAVKAIGNMEYTDRKQLLFKLRGDPSDYVRGSVKLLIARD